FFHHRDLDLRKRVEKTLANAPPVVAQRIDALGDEATLDDLLSVLPTGRLDGALLSRKTRAHWIYALVSAAFFLGTILVLFPRGTETARQLLLAGAFTGTVGIFFLLAVQAIASSTGGMWIRGGGKAAIIYLILKFIGFSYRAALDPDNGFLASFFGFTCGVGLCEELSKAIPVIFHYRTGGKMTWRGASLWGMASGVGFGVSEGITYSSDFYNGIEGGEIYIVRFVSCVALHAFWAAAAGIALSKASDALSAPGETRAAWIPILKAVAVPMVLHGLYDTLLKQDHGIPAFVVAALSFAWLALQIELARKEDGRSAAPALNSA
ncbi:PrsW family intramembrane metalloprotease, partial [bacterium]|nr:PrsW family intramembrane metalloprotease [bacterium]